jgi:hypothetical protein
MKVWDKSDLKCAQNYWVRVAGLVCVCVSEGEDILKRSFVLCKKFLRIDWFGLCKGARESFKVLLRVSPRPIPWMCDGSTEKRRVDKRNQEIHPSISTLVPELRLQIQTL